MSPQTRGRLLLALVALAAAMGFWAPAFLAGDASGFGDWQWFHHQWEAGRVAVLRWREWPLFDPHHCGGVPLWGNPQAQVYSPTWLLTGLPFGTTLGHKLFLVWHTAVAFAGVFVLARRELRLGVAGAALAAFAWSCSGFFAWHGAGGHSTFAAFAYGPWILWFWRRAEHDLRWAGAVALGMGLVLSEGGHYPFPYFVLLLGFDAAARIWPFASGARTARVARAAVVAGGLTAAVGAYRVVPIFLTVSRFPKPVDSVDALRLGELLEMLTARSHPWVFAGHRWVWAEYGAFVGWTVLALAAAGAVVSLRRRGGAWLLAGLVLFGAFTLGAVEPWYPWPLVHRLPFYGSLHVPSRFRVLLTLFLALLAGVALDRLARALRERAPTPRARRFAAAVPWLALAVAVADLYVVNLRTNDRWNGPPIRVDRVEARFHQVHTRTYFDEYARFPLRNVGTRRCYDPIPWKVPGGLRIGDRPQARVEPRGAGEVTAETRTSRTLSASVRLELPALVVFNQTFHPEMAADVGTVVDHRGLLAVELPAGEHEVRVVYAPADLPWTPLASLAGTAASIALLRRRRG